MIFLIILFQHFSHVLSFFHIFTFQYVFLVLDIFLFFHQCKFEIFELSWKFLTKSNFLLSPSFFLILRRNYFDFCLNIMKDTLMGNNLLKQPLIFLLLKTELYEPPPLTPPKIPISFAKKHRENCKGNELYIRIPLKLQIFQITS